MASDTPMEKLEDAPTRVRVADALPYRYLGRVGNLDLVHLLADQSFGIGFEIAVPSVESVTNAEQWVSDVLDQMIRKLPDGYVIQWYRKNSTDVSDYLDLYTQQAGKDELGQAICKAVVDRWTDASKRGFFPGDDVNFFPCREEMAIMIKSPSSNVFDFDPNQAWALLVNPNEPSKRYNEYAKTFQSAVREIREIAVAGSVSLAAMTGWAFVPFVVTMLAPYGGRRETIPQFSEIDAVSEAISAAITVDLAGGGDKVRLDSVKVVRNAQASYHRVVSMLWQPRAVKPGMTNDIMYKHPSITMVTTVEMVPQLKESTKLKAAQFIQSKTVTVFNQQEAAEKERSYQDVHTRLFNGEKICLFRQQAIVTALTDEEAEDAALRVKSSMESSYPSVSEDKFGASLLLLGSLPFTASSTRESVFKRQRRMLSRDIADLIPAGGRWTGVVPTAAYLSVETNRKKPIVMYSNSVGGPLFISPDKCDANPHVLIIGGSGSGKTFYLQDLLMQMQRIPDMRAYLISIKPDYKRLSNIFGTYVDVDLDNESISVNPLGGEPTLANQAMWTQAVCLMYSDGDPEDRPTRDERVMIEEAVMAAATKNWDVNRRCQIKETILSDVVAYLVEQGVMGSTIANRLKPYYTGAYKNLINRPRTITKDNKFLFFNLAGISKSAGLGVIMFSLFTFIDGIMYDPAMVGFPKVVVFDEGWAGMSDKHTAALMDKSARAYRSLGGQAVYISQMFGDFDTDLGRAILGNTATKIILPQDQSELLKLPNYIDINEREMEAVRALKLHKRRYSEFFVKMQGLYSTTGRVIPDALKYAVATTDADDEELHARLLAECGGDFKLSVNRFATEYPFGNPVN